MTGPNRFICQGSPHVQGTFGAIAAITHIHHVDGAGHVESIRLACKGGFVLELTQAFAMELARRLPESLAALPELPDCSGAAWNGLETADG